MRESEKQLFALQFKMWAWSFFWLVIIVVAIVVGGDDLKKFGGEIVKTLAGKVEGLQKISGEFVGRDLNEQTKPLKK